VSRRQFRRVIRLERRSLSYIHRQQEARQLHKEFELSPDDLTCLRAFAFRIAAAVCLFTLYGDPNIDEPLTEAWRRCLESEAWTSCGERHGHLREYIIGTYPADVHPTNEDLECGQDLFDDQGLVFVSDYFAKYLMPELPGADQIEKLNAILARASPWLLWFTQMDYHGYCLGLQLPDLSSVSRIDRLRYLTHRLPTGPFQCRLLPDGIEDPTHKLLSRWRIDFTHLTRRERERTIRIYKAIGVSLAGNQGD
jgi:hypothetical protein